MAKRAKTIDLLRGVDPLLDRGRLAGAEGAESGAGRFAGGPRPDVPTDRGEPRSLLPALSGSAARVLRRGLPTLHGPRGDGGASTVRPRDRARARAVRRP